MRSAIIAAVVALLVSAAGATAATVITGAQIKDGTVTGKDIRNGTIKPADLAKSARGTQGPVGQTGPQGPKGDTGQAASFFIGRFSEVATAAPSTTGSVTAACPHGQVVTMTHRMGGDGTIDQHAVVTSVSLHDTTAVLSVRNNGTDPVQFIGTVTCVDTQPF